MRKAQKENAEALTDLLKRAHDEIRRAVERKKIPAALALLEDCQQAAISLGGLTEEAEGENHAVIPLLEKYCEQIYQFHEKLMEEEAEQGFSADTEDIFGSVQKSLCQIKDNIQQVRIRREVVFLPYKASMWDSLESVWRAADEDPDCDAYVIPIPYYDKNPDGSFREAHYEGDQYPEYVPVTWYEVYDFAKRQPDMIFIHNPYDEWNHVTSVHPFFYTKNLKQFTEQLIYIPYFILGEVDPEDEEALKGIEHFCTVPGVIYADRVIVQSEKMRQAYIHVMTDFLTEQGYGRGYWEEKILGLGSPKIDKVQSTKKMEAQ